MSVIATTTASAVRETLISTISRIVPRYQPKSAGGNWRHVGDDDRAEPSSRVLRQFQVLCRPETEVSGWYSGGLEQATATTVRVGYPLQQTEMERAAGADQIDLALILAVLHQQLPGMIPVQVDAGREQQLITITQTISKDHGYVVDFNIVPGLHFFASDQVTLLPEGT